LKKRDKKEMPGGRVLGEKIPHEHKDGNVHYRSVAVDL